MKLNDILPENMKWGEVTSTLHQHHTVDGKDNIKYISADGHFEIVYNGNNETQNQYNNPDDIRTYNYYSPTTEIVQHGEYDHNKVVFIL